MPDRVQEAAGGGGSGVGDEPRPPDPSVSTLAARDPRPGRERMLAVARRLFSSRGFDRTPLRAISEALGVTKAAVYYHFRAKDDLLVAIVAPLLDRIDELVEPETGPLDAAGGRRRFLQRYVDVLSDDVEVTSLLLRDPAVAEHALGRRFVAQRERIRALLGAGASLPAGIRASTALRTLELAMVEFGDAEPSQVRETALNVAVAVLDAAGAAGNAS